MVTNSSRDFDVERFDARLETDNPCDRLFAELHMEFYRRTRRFILGMPKRPGPPVAIIDAGCGLGNLAPHLQDLGRYIGVDRSSETIAECRTRYPEAQFQIGDLTDEHVFDDLEPKYITSFEFLEHLPDPDRFLRSCYTTLKRHTQRTETAGFLICSAPVLKTRDWTPFHLHDRTFDQWKSAITATGFTILSEDRIGFECDFRDFADSGPKGERRRQQIRHITRYLFTHPSYWPERLYWWALKGRFRAQSGFFIAKI